MAKAADAIAAGDVVNRRVRQYQNWSLMPFAAAMGSVYPAAYMRGQREVFGLYPNEPNFPRFTAWLGSNSSAGKGRRQLGELHTRMLSSGHVECDRCARPPALASAAGTSPPALEHGAGAPARAH